MNDTTPPSTAATPPPPDGAREVLAQPWSCPGWCSLPPGHGFEPLINSADSARTHEVVELDLRVRDALSWRRHERSLTSVIICQEELLLGGGTGGIVRKAPFLLLVSDWENLSTSEARRLGDALRDAADRVDQLTAEMTR